MVDAVQGAQVVSAALATGAAAALHEQASAAVTSALESLRAVASRVFGVDPVASTAVAKLQEDIPPGELESWGEQLEQRLQTVGEAQLRELVARAQAVLAVTDPTGTTEGRYAMALDLRDAKGVQVNQGGSGHSQTNTFS